MKFVLGKTKLGKRQIKPAFPKLKSQKRRNNSENSGGPLKKQLLHLQMRWWKFYLP